MDLNYQRGLWLGFEPALNKYYSTRNKIQTLIYVMSEKTNYEIEYAENLINLSDILNDCLTLKDKENASLSTLDNLIQSFLLFLKQQSDVIQQNANKIFQEYLKELSALTSAQNDLTKDLKNTIENYPKSFIESYEKLKGLKMNYFKSASDSEKLIHQNLEWKKNEKNSSKNRKKIQERDKAQMKAIESLKAAEKQYRDFLPEINKERDNFISKTEDILSSFENMEKELITKIQNKLQGYQQTYSQCNNSLEPCINDFNDKIKKLSFDEDNQKFLAQNQTFLTPPSVFTFQQYHPQSIRTLNSTDEISKTLARETLTTLKTLLSMFQQFQKGDTEEETQNYEFLEETILNIIEEKEINSRKMNELMKSQIYREYFLSYLNNIRKEGIISLKKKSFNSLCEIFSFVLKIAQQNNDGICLNTLLTLSQAFCLGEGEPSSIKNAIVNNEIWKDSNVWISIITATILNELSSLKEYPAYIKETQKERDTRKHSVVFGKLVNFFFLMKEFNFPNNEVMNILKLFSTKYSVSLDAITNIEANQEIINEETTKNSLKGQDIETIVKMK